VSFESSRAESKKKDTISTNSKKRRKEQKSSSEAKHTAVFFLKSATRRLGTTLGASDALGVAVNIEGATEQEAEVEGKAVEVDEGA
jgi:hypothetical protein